MCKCIILIIQSLLRLNGSAAHVTWCCMAAHRSGAQTKGSKPDKIIRDALLIELNRMTTDDGQKIKKVNRIVAKLVGAGMEGKIDAIREIFDRVEGKASQSIGIGQAEDLAPLETIVRPQLSREAWLALHGVSKGAK